MRDTVSKPHRRTAELSTAPPDAALSVDDASFARDYGGSDETAKVHNVNGKHRHDCIASAEGTFPAMSLSPLSNSGTATLRFAEPCELVELFFSGSTLAEAGDGGPFSVQSSNENGWLFSSRR